MKPEQPAPKGDGTNPAAKPRQTALGELLRSYRRQKAWDAIARLNATPPPPCTHLVARSRYAQ